jgi:hypothetical protein
LIPHQRRQAEKGKGKVAAVNDELVRVGVEERGELGRGADGKAVVMGETGRLQDWKDCCYYCCYGKEREMERCGSSQGLDLGVAAGG